MSIECFQVKQCGFEPNAIECFQMKQTGYEANGFLYRLFCNKAAATEDNKQKGEYRNRKYY